VEWLQGSRAKAYFASLPATNKKGFIPLTPGLQPPRRSCQVEVFLRGCPQRQDGRILPQQVHSGKWPLAKRLMNALQTSFIFILMSLKT